MWPLALLLLAGGAVVAMSKPAQTVTAPLPGTREELLANTLPDDFYALVRGASPRQLENIVRIAQYQLRKLGEPVTVDGVNSAAFRFALLTRYRARHRFEDGPGYGQGSWNTATASADPRIGDPRVNPNFFAYLDSEYRGRFRLPSSQLSAYE